MDRTLQRQRAERFARMHHGPDILVVGSVWGAGSAVVFERAGFAALATSSAGIAFSLGYADGQLISRDAISYADANRLFRGLERVGGRGSVRAVTKDE